MFASSEGKIGFITKTERELSVKELINYIPVTQQKPLNCEKASWGLRHT